MTNEEKLQKALDEMILRFPKHIDQIDNIDFRKGFIAGWNTGNLIFGEKILMILEEWVEEGSEIKKEIGELIKSYTSRGEDERRS